MRFFLHLFCLLEYPNTQWLIDSTRNHDNVVSMDAVARTIIVAANATQHPAGLTKRDL